MPWKDSDDSFGRVSIIVHWTSALLVIALLVIGFQAYFLGRGAERSALLYLHVSLGLTLIPVHTVRVAWRWRYGKPKTPQSSRILQLLAETVWRLLVFLVAVQLITGPFLVWLHGRPVAWFGLFEIAPPFHLDEGLHERLVGPIHLAVGLLLVMTIGLHILGALKHLLLDRDHVVGRMFGAGKTAKRDSVASGETA